MKKIAFILSLIILCSFTLYSASILSDEFLLKNKFESNEVFSATDIVFLKNKKYQITYGSEGLYWYNEGKYEIKDNKITLTPEICKDRKDGDIINCNESINNGFCLIKDDPESLYYSKKLLCQSVNNKDKMGFDSDGINFNILSSKVKAGEKKEILKADILTEDGQVEKTINVNIPVYIMDQVEGIVKTNLKMRSLPSTDSQIVYYVYDEFVKPTKYIPQNTKIKIIARTIEKVSVDKWNNYWYYVVAGFHDGWVFGEFVDVKEK